jgi:hypothetical protein
MKGFMADMPVTYTNGDETTGKSVPFENIPAYVADLANKEKVSQIKIIGNTLFAESTIEDILCYSQTKYSNNNLEIEVISE